MMFGAKQKADFMGGPPNGALEEVEFHNGEVVDRWWILHHFRIDSFCP